MTPLSPTRRDADAFANALDAHAGNADERFTDLLECVEVLRTQEPPAPRADFVADLRMRLMDAADTLLLPEGAELAPVVPLHASPAARRQRRISVAAAAFVVLGGSAGVAVASESSLPGDPLYPLKRGIESAQVSFNSSESGRGQDMLRVAATRLAETEELIIKREDAGLINSTLASFQESAGGGADRLFSAYQSNGESEEISRLRAMLGTQMAKLDSLSATAPVESMTTLDQARALLVNLDKQASVLCGNCGPDGISDRFRSAASSAPSLATLLQAPAANAQQAAAEAARNSELAQKADEIAKNTDQAPVGTDEVTPSTPGANPTTGLPLPAETPDLTSPLVGLTSGVTALLREVGGEPLAPVTDTLDTLTGGLLK